MNCAVNLDEMKSPQLVSFSIGINKCLNSKIHHIVLCPVVLLHCSERGSATNKTMNKVDEQESKGRLNQGWFYTQDSNMVAFRLNTGQTYD